MALSDKLSETDQQSDGSADELRAIAERCGTFPALDSRTPEEMIGFDEYGLPR